MFTLILARRGSLYTTDKENSLKPNLIAPLESSFKMRKVTITFVNQISTTCSIFITLIDTQMQQMHENNYIINLTLHCLIVHHTQATLCKEDPSCCRVKELVNKSNNVLLCVFDVFLRVLGEVGALVSLPEGAVEWQHILPVVLLQRFPQLIVRNGVPFLHSCDLLYFFVEALKEQMNHAAGHCVQCCFGTDKVYWKVCISLFKIINHRNESQ